MLAGAFFAGMTEASQFRYTGYSSHWNLFA